MGWTEIVEDREPLIRPRGTFDDLIPGGPAANKNLRDAKQQPNPFDQFDAPSSPAKKKEKSFLEWVGNDLTGLANNNTRGSIIGGVAKGIADYAPGFGAGSVQLAANALGAGDSVNKSIAHRNHEYQAARQSAGRDGFDAAYAVGSLLSSALPGGAIGKVSSGAKLGTQLAVGATQGAVNSAASPVVNGGDAYWRDKASDVAIGAATGTALVPVARAIARVVNPRAANNPDVKLLQDAGVRLTPGQALGGVARNVEEKMQSVFGVGNMIDAAKLRSIDDMNIAAMNRAMQPLGKSAQYVGTHGVADAKAAFKEAYDNVIPSLNINVTDSDLVSKVANLRSMVQSLPQRESNLFDDVIARQIDQRLAPNGVLSGQNLKDALGEIRDLGAAFSRSNDAYQSQLGQALKQLHRELLGDLVTKGGDAGLQLRKIDEAYTNFKRVERANASTGTAGGSFSPSQFYSATKALDRSKDKGAFAAGSAPMQDLSGAAMRVLGNRVPDSGSAGRLIAGGLALGTISPGALAATSLPSIAYLPPVQNALVKLMTRRPEYAERIANKLSEFIPTGGTLLSAQATANQSNLR